MLSQNFERLFSCVPRRGITCEWHAHWHRSLAARADGTLVCGLIRPKVGLRSDYLKYLASICLCQKLDPYYTTHTSDYVTKNKRLSGNYHTTR